MICVCNIVFSSVRVHDHIVKVCEHNILQNSLWNFHKIDSLGAVGDKDLGQKVKCQGQTRVKSHVIKNAPFRRRRTALRFAVEDRLVCFLKLPLYDE